MPNPVTHFEIVGRDAGGLQRFYSEAFAWELEGAGPSYAMVYPRAETGIDGGIGSPPEGGDASRVTVYIAVDDVEEALRRVESLGRSRFSPAPRLSRGLDDEQCSSAVASGDRRGPTPVECRHAHACIRRDALRRARLELGNLLRPIVAGALAH